MKIVQEKLLIDNDRYSQTAEYATIYRTLKTAISKIVWPSGSQKFTVNPGKHINGVVPIKDAFVNHLTELGWVSQQPFVAVSHYKPGDFDAALKVANGKYFAVEWETGNISSSHRSVNRMILGMKNGQLIGGALVLPTRNLYNYLTDRIGNFEELEPYFSLWKDVIYRPALLLILAVEHDAISTEVPPIKKGTDGRALG